MICRFAQGAARRDFTPVDNLFLSEYMPHSTGVQTQAYLYGLMQCCHPSMADLPLAEALGLDEAAVRDAFVYWQAQGLVRITSERPLVVEYRLSGETAEGGEAVPAKYHALVRSLQTLTAPRQFGMRELRHVYDWIEVYGLDEGAVLALVSHCLALRGPRVSVNYISAVAQSFSEAGVRTHEDALAYIEASDLRRTGAAEILRQWNKRRKPTADELARYEKWTGEWGFTPEAIRAALPRLTASGSPNFAYLEDVLSDLKQQGAATADDVARDDQTAAREKDFARLLFERAGKVEPATRTQRRQIGMFLNELGMPPELMLYAAELSRGAGEPFGLIKIKLSDWHEHGIKTVAEAQAREAGRHVKAQQRSGRYAGTQGPQHDVSDAQLAPLLVDLDQDV